MEKQTTWFAIALGSRYCSSKFKGLLLKLSVFWTAVKQSHDYLWISSKSVSRSAGWPKLNLP